MRMTPEQMLKEVAEMLKPIIQRLERIENGGTLNVPVQPKMADNDFIVDGQIRHYNIPPEKQKEFFDRCGGLMKEYGVFSISVGLYKKF